MIEKSPLVEDEFISQNTLINELHNVSQILMGPKLGFHKN